MPAECPNCRRSISWFQTFRKHAWARWNCPGCGALLGMDTRRRLLGMFPWAAVVLVLIKIVDVTSLGMVLAAPIILVAAVTCFYFIDRVVVVERTGFLCRSCGYDLWGQTASPCPECGTAFEVADLDQRRAGQAHEQPVRHRRSHREWLGILLLLLVGVATLVLGIMTYRARRGGPTPAPPNAVQPAN